MDYLRYSKSNKNKTLWEIGRFIATNHHTQITFRWSQELNDHKRIKRNID